MLLAGVLALCGLGSAGAGAASAAPGYRLAFGSTIDTSASGGPLIVKGHRATTADPMIADQIIDYEDPDPDTVRPGIGQLIYEAFPGSLSHRHWHYKAFVRYQLRSTSDLSLVRPDNKAGFCLSDPAYAPDFCGSVKPDALTIDEGLGPGTSDYYPPTLEGQYIDVAGVPPGDYWLVHWVNSAKEICESNYANNAAAVKIALWPNGYGVAPYFTQKEAVNPFPSLYADLNPPLNCDQASTPGFGAPDLTPKTPAELGITAVDLGDARLCVPAKAKAGKSRIGPARIRRSGKVFKTRYRPGRRKGRVIRYCLHNKAKGRFYVGSTRKGVIEFVASTARRHSTRKYRPGKRVKSGRIRGTRRIARGVFLGRGKRSRAVYGVRRGKVTFVAAVSRNQWRKPRKLVKRLRALKLTPKATAKRKARRG